MTALFFIKKSAPKIPFIGFAFSRIKLVLICCMSSRTKACFPIACLPKIKSHAERENFNVEENGKPFQASGAGKDKVNATI